MKTKSDPRHLKRKVAIKELFAESYTHQAQVSELTKNVYSKKAELDSLIEDCAPAWPAEKLNRIDLAILRLAVYELIYETNTPHKVIIDEAIELAKEYGSESSSQFINGVLGAVYEKRKKK